MNVEALEKRLIALEDQDEIRKLHQYYMSLMDNLEFDKIPELFVDDAIVEIRNYGVTTGKAAIIEQYTELAKKRKDVKDGHMAVQPDILVEGNKGFGTWLVYILFSKPSVQWVQGINECEYIKEKGEWKFRKLKFTRTNASKPDMFP